MRFWLFERCPFFGGIFFSVAVFASDMKAIDSCRSLMLRVGDVVELSESQRAQLKWDGDTGRRSIVTDVHFEAGLSLRPVSTQTLERSLSVEIPLGHLPSGPRLQPELSGWPKLIGKTDLVHKPVAAPVRASARRSFEALLEFRVGDLVRMRDFDQHWVILALRSWGTEMECVYRRVERMGKGFYLSDPMTYRFSVADGFIPQARFLESGVLKIDGLTLVTHYESPTAFHRPAKAGDIFRMNGSLYLVKDASFGSIHENESSSSLVWEIEAVKFYTDPMPPLLRKETRRIMMANLTTEKVIQDQGFFLAKSSRGDFTPSEEVHLVAETKFRFMVWEQDIVESLNRDAIEHFGSRKTLDRGLTETFFRNYREAH